MTIYVDPLYHWGMRYRGHSVKTCHMITDQVDLTELHDMATKLGLRRYFQDKPGKPHYDLMAGKRAEAVRFGALEVSTEDIIIILRNR